MGTFCGLRESVMDTLTDMKCWLASLGKGKQEETQQRERKEEKCTQMQYIHQRIGKYLIELGPVSHKHWLST